MDESALLGALAAVAIVAVIGVGGTAGYFYATDYALEADVKGKQCGGPLAQDLLNVVSVRTSLFGIDHDVSGIPDRECTILSEGDRVVYHIRTKHTLLYDAEGDCVYDSEKGVGCGVVGL